MLDTSDQTQVVPAPANADPVEGPMELIPFNTTTVPAYGLKGAAQPAPDINTTGQVAPRTPVAGVLDNPFTSMGQWAQHDEAIANMPDNRLKYLEVITKLDIVAAIAGEGVKIPRRGIEFTKPDNQIAYDPELGRPAYVGRPSVPINLGPFDNLMALGGHNDVIVLDFDWGGMGPELPKDFANNHDAMFGFMYGHGGFKEIWDFMIDPEHGDGLEAAAKWLKGTLIPFSPKNGFHIVCKAAQDCGYTADGDILGVAKGLGKGIVDARYTNAYAITIGSATIQKLKTNGALQAAQGRYLIGQIPEGLEYTPPKTLAFLKRRMEEKRASHSRAHTATLNGGTALGAMTVANGAAGPAAAGSGGNALGMDTYSMQCPLEMLARHIFAMSEMQKEASNAQPVYLHPYDDRDRWRDEVWFAWQHMETRGYGCETGEARLIVEALSRYDEQLCRKAGRNDRVFDPVGDMKQFDKAAKTMPSDSKAKTYKAIYEISNDRGWDTKHKTREKAEAIARGMVPSLTGRVDAQQQTLEVHRTNHINTLRRGGNSAKHPGLVAALEKAAEIHAVVEAGGDESSINVDGMVLLDHNVPVPEDLARELFVFVEDHGGKGVVFDLRSPGKHILRNEFAASHQSSILLGDGTVKPLGKYLCATSSARITTKNAEWNPDRDAGVFINEHGATVWNLFTGWPLDEYDEMPRSEARKKSLHMRRMLFEVVAGRNKKIYKFLLKNMAFKFKHPTAVTGVALTFSGEEGAGKSAYVDIYDVAFGEHCVTYSDAATMNQKHNEELQFAVLARLEEGTNTGNAVHEQKRKHFISGKNYFIEPKGLGKIKIKNKLMLTATTNKEHAVEIGGIGRREFVHEVIQPVGSWVPYGPQWALYHDDLNGKLNSYGNRPGTGPGTVALWQYLKGMKLGSWRPMANVVQTSTKAKQKKFSEPATRKGFFWHILDTKVIPGKGNVDWEAGPVTLSESDMVTFINAGEAWRASQPMKKRDAGDNAFSPVSMGMALGKFMGIKSAVSNNQRTWTFPRHDVCRDMFENAAGAVGSVER